MYTDLKITVQIEIVRHRMNKAGEAIRAATSRRRHCQAPCYISSSMRWRNQREGAFLWVPMGLRRTTDVEQFVHSISTAAKNKSP